MPLLTAVGDCLHKDRGLVMMRETFNLPLPSASLSTLLPPCTTGPLLASRTKTHPFMRFPLDVIKTRAKVTCLILVAYSHRASPGSSEKAKEFLCAAEEFCLCDLCTEKTRLSLCGIVHHKGTSGRHRLALHKCYPFKVSCGVQLLHVL